MVEEGEDKRMVSERRGDIGWREREREKEGTYHEPKWTERAVPPRRKVRIVFLSFTFAIREGERERI